MKKTFLKLTLLAILPVLSGCGNNKSNVCLIGKHKYGEYTINEDGTHSKTCTLCGDVLTNDHVWNNGSNTTPATHINDGVKTYECTRCGATRTETIEKTSEHEYGSWTSINEYSHKKTCTCGNVYSLSHSFDGGVITKEATHIEDGEKTYTCSDCGYTKTEKIDKIAEHQYSNWISLDSQYHGRECSCGDDAIEEHTFDEGTITSQGTIFEKGVKTYTCTKCGEEKTESIFNDDTNYESIGMLKQAISNTLNYVGNYRRNNTWYYGDTCWEESLIYNNENKETQLNIYAMSNGDKNVDYYNVKNSDNSYSLYQKVTGSDVDKHQYVSNEGMSEYLLEKYLGYPLETNTAHDFSLKETPYVNSVALDEIPSWLNVNNCDALSSFATEGIKYANKNKWYANEKFVDSSSTLTLSSTSNNNETFYNIELELLAQIDDDFGDIVLPGTSSASLKITYSYTFDQNHLIRGISRTYDTYLNYHLVDNTVPTVENTRSYSNYETFSYGDDIDKITIDDEDYIIVNDYKNNTFSYKIYCDYDKESGCACLETYDTLFTDIKPGTTLNFSVLNPNNELFDSFIMSEQIDKLYLDPDCTIELTETVAPSGYLELYCKSSLKDDYIVAKIESRYFTKYASEINNNFECEYMPTYLRTNFTVQLTNVESEGVINLPLDKYATPFEFYGYGWFIFKGICINETFVSSADLTNQYQTMIDNNETIIFVYEMCEEPTSI